MTDDRPEAIVRLDEALGDAGRRSLAELARREALAAAGEPQPEPASTGTVPPLEVYGAFVSFHLGGRLRGCMGVLGRPFPVVDAVRDAARSAAVRDPRFPPMQPAEIRTADLEVSLLTPIEWVDPDLLPDAIRIGIDGLVAEQGPQRGLLLPQVATEHGLDAPTFLAETCRKAGLPPDAWRHGARIGRFQALVIREA
ncbi:MAG: hypothetical protein Kow0062_01610 [Acidobacteriota bacterium]